MDRPRRTALLAGVAAMILATGFISMVARGQVGPDPGYRPDETPAPPVGEEQLVTGPAASPLAKQSSECIDLRGGTSSVATSDGLAEYVEKGEEVLRSVSAVADREVRAGINFARLMPPDDLAAFIEDNDLNWQNIFWEASNGVHGAISAAEGAQSLLDVEETLKKSGELGDLDFMGGAYYVIVDGAKVSTLAKLQDEESVALVDIGRLPELDAANTSGTCVWFTLPDPIWFAAKEVGYDLGAK